MRGFTLIELIVAVSVVTLFGLLALPSLSDYLARNSVDAATAELEAAVNFSRTAALTYRTRTVLCRSGNSAAATPGCDRGSAAPTNDGYEDGWIVFLDPAADNAPASPRSILRRSSHVGRGSLTIRGNHNAVNRIYFSPMGATAAISTLVICDRLGWAKQGRDVRLVTIDMGGRVRSSSGDRQSGTTVSSCTP